MPTTFQRLELLNRQIHQAHRVAVGEELARRGLSEVNPMILAILKHVEQTRLQSFSQRDMAGTLHVSPAAVTNSLKAMEKNGYIIREPEQADARRNRMALTDKGRAAVVGCEEALLSVSERMLKGFSPEERALLAEFRVRMLNNLCGTAPARKEEP